jgi:CRP/FNR family transcriptional regulator, anaerobic regulatory protein
MKTTRSPVSVCRDLASPPHGASGSVRDYPSLKLQSAQERLSALQGELVSSRQALLDCRRQMEVLSSANDDLRRHVAQHGREAASNAGANTFRITGATGFAHGLGAHFADLARVLLAKRVHVAKGGELYGAGAACKGLYVVRNGSLATVLIGKDGHTQIGDFHIAGDLVGVDGMLGDLHHCQAVALEDSDVILMPLDQVHELARTCDQFRKDLQAALAHECVRAHAMMLTLGTRRADQRVASFLLEVSRRHQAIGYSSSELCLRMTRNEIGSYLGLKLETVSRLLSKLQRVGTIRVTGRAVRLLDREALKGIADGEA